MERQIQEWEKEINQVITEAKKRKEHPKSDFENALEKIHTRKEDTLNRLLELKESREDAWEELKQGFEHSWKELRSTIERTKSKFK